jgi:hypothetical protein
MSLGEIESMIKETKERKDQVSFCFVYLFTNNDKMFVFDVV